MTSFPSRRMEGIEKTLIRQINDRADASCINLGIGELAFPTPAAILERLAAEVKTWPLGYTPNAGLPELRQLIAQRTGAGISAEQVCVTIGAEEALFALLMILANPGDEVLVPDPGFPTYPAIVRMAGGTPVGYILSPANRFALDVEEVSRRITPRTRLLVLNSPNNPTGAVYSGAELKALAALCGRHGLTVLSDEVYREILYEGRADSIARHYERTIVINSLSKMYSMTGWRLGWCIAPLELIRTVITFNQLAISCPPAICQRAAILALQGHGDQEKAQNLEELKRRRDLAAQCLDRYTGLKFDKPRGAFYIYTDISPRLSPSRTSWDVALELIDKQKVVTIPGIAFGPAAANFLRLSFAARPENIEEGIRRIGHHFSRA
jgi:aspartate/methionine/tyrosine aminotransferase